MDPERCVSFDRFLLRRSPSALRPVSAGGLLSSFGWELFMDAQA